MIDGYPAFASDLTTAEQGYRDEYFAELAMIEARNFWFRARNRLIAWSARRYFPTATSFLEIGCGTGFVLQGLASAFPAMRLTGSEIASAGLPFAARRSSASLFQMDARRIPFADEFDIVGAFDVLEHIEEDEDVLAETYRATVPGGGILITVPQHMSLWSAQDTYACHVRRYERADLVKKVRRVGYNMIRITSFVTLLLPLLRWSRSRAKTASPTFDAMAELRMPPVPNFIFERILDLERQLIRLGCDLHHGGSLLMIASKPAVSEQK